MAIGNRRGVNRHSEAISCGIRGKLPPMSPKYPRSSLIGYLWCLEMNSELSLRIFIKKDNNSMGRKIFVSYKHADDSVYPINGGITARAYVNELIRLFEGDEIYKGEGNEDLTRFKDETIQTHLKNKIYDSSITLVLISPNMRNWNQPQFDQWIPWEISYSLKEIPRQGRRSLTNAMLAVVLPDRALLYSYFLEDSSCPDCHRRIVHRSKLFPILRDNMFNIKENKRTYYICPGRCNNDNPVFTGQPSYIASVKWHDFIADTERHLTMAEDIRDKIDDYDITKMVTE